MIALTKRNFFSKSEEEKKDFLISNYTAKELAELVIKYSVDKSKPNKAQPQLKKMKISKAEFEKYFEFKSTRQRRKKIDTTE